MGKYFIPERTQNNPLIMKESKANGLAELRTKTLRKMISKDIINNKIVTIFNSLQ